MQKTRLLLATIAGFSFLSFAALADVGNPLIGKWVEKFANGASMQTEFTTTSISSTPMDAAGKPSGSTITAQVTYKNLGHNEKMGDGYSIDFVTPDGKPAGPGIMGYLKTPDALELDFPSASTHNLKRVK